MEPPSWTDGIAYELAFWDDYLETKGGRWPEDYKQRLNPREPVSDSYVELLDQLSSNPVRVLDVGAGPLTIFGRTHPRKEIVLTATDALAHEYDTLLDRYGIVPPVRTIYAEAENLTALFPAESFDLVHARNSIDHCRSPYEAIRQMLAVVKIGGLVWLGHAENEAEKEGYTGFHQWNFTVRDGDFIIWGKHHQVNVTRQLAAVAAVAATCHGWVVVTMKKTHSTPQ